MQKLLVVFMLKKPSVETIIPNGVQPKKLHQSFAYPLPIPPDPVCRVWVWLR